MPGLHPRIDAATHATLKTRTRLAPNVLQGLKVLSLPTSSLASYAYEAAEANPFLEVNYGSDLFEFDLLPSEQAIEEALRRKSADRGGTAGEAATRTTVSGHGISSHFEWDFSRIRDEYSATDTIRSHLRVQAAALQLDDADRRLLDAIIECISDDGYFDGSLGEVAFEQDVSPEDAERMLGIVQGMDPAGVGARDISECLALQVPPGHPYHRELLCLVEEHLEDLASSRMTALARALGVKPEVASMLAAQVRQMDPRPASAFYQAPVYNYVVPDIVVSFQNGDFEAVVPGAGQPCLVLNGEYLALRADRTLGPEARGYLDSACREAEAIIRNIDQRRQMLQRFAVYLVKRQSAYFLTGGRKLSPLTMQEAADELGVNVSTISRTVQNKYLQTPWGTFPLKQFFTRGLAQSDAQGQGEVSSFEVKRQISQLVESEPADAPYSDAALTEMLNERGVDIKRRTVAKYRTALGIGTQSERKRAIAGRRQ